MVFAKLLKIVNKTKDKSVADLVKEQPELPDQLLSLIAQLGLSQQVALLAEVKDTLTRDGRDKLIEFLGVQDFPRQLVKEVQKNNSVIAAEAITSLCLFPTNQVVDGLIQLLSMKNELHRFEAAKALIDLQDPLVVQALTKVLDYPKQWVPARITEIMVAYKEEAVAQLLAIFATASQEKQILILEMLAVLGHPASEDIFIRSLRAENSAIRVAAVKGLGALAQWSNPAVLDKIFQDQAPVVRLQAVRIFVKENWTSVQGFYWQALVDEDWLVRSAAAEILWEKSLLNQDLFELVGKTRLNPELMPEVTRAVKNYLDRG